MEKKNFTQMPELPSGRASKKIVEGCAVIEGGAFRGVYSQGVLDALMLNDINLRCTIGVSAGALNGMCYVAGDIGRAIRMILMHRRDPRYVGLLPFFTDSGVIGFDFMFYETPKYLKFNFERFFSPERRFAAVVTNCLTGEMEVFERGKCDNIFDAIQASASMPYLSKPVMLDNVPYLDGGCTRNDPWQWAKDEGYEKILLIRNRPIGYRAPDKPNKKARIYANKYPNLARALENDHRAYTQECIDAENAAEAGEVYMICPSTNETVSRLENDLERLELFYWLGFYETQAQMADIKAYLEV